MRVPLAWLNVTHNKVRALASLSGVTLAILLMFMQLGFYDACFRSSTMIFDQFEFDIALVSPQYVHMRAAFTFPRIRIQQARSVPGVASAAPLYVNTGFYRNPQNQFQLESIVLAVDPRNPMFRLPRLKEQGHKLEKPDTALIDTRYQKQYGTADIGTVTALENHKVTIAGTYQYGSGFICDGSIVISDRTLARCLGGYPLETVSIGLVTVEPGQGIETVMAELRRVLPPDVQVLRRSSLEEIEQNFYVKVKPIGIMFSGGVLLAFIVGGVILYQVLSSEIMNRLKEYATLKAIGYTDEFMTSVVLQQAAFFAVLGYIPALIQSLVLYEVTFFMVGLPMTMTIPRLLLVLGLSVGMCVFAGLLVSQKVRKADPAELF
jgi:putative ABC transport system permease protein